MTRRLLPVLTLLFATATGCSSGGAVQENPGTTIDPTESAPPRANGSNFTLSSPDMETGGEMPVKFTCDGLSQSPSLSWTDGPTGTKGYAIAMHHIPGPGDTHWYWVVYDIPSSVHSVPAGGPAPGSVGTNSVNNQLAYAPPCSKGPGPKLYTITVYALSGSPGFAPGSAVSRDQLLAAISTITLASSSIDVTYERT